MSETRVQKCKYHGDTLFSKRKVATDVESVQLMRRYTSISLNQEIEMASEVYTLESIEAHASHIRDNAYEVNSILRGILSHLRGEVPTAMGGTDDSIGPTGKLEEISTNQQWARGAQDETFRLITELQELLSVNA